MRRLSGSPTSRVALRLSTVSLVAIGLGACSSETMRFSENPFSSPFQTAQASQPRDPMTTGSINRAPVAQVQSQPIRTVSSQPLPPPQSSVALRTAPVQPVVSAPAVQAPRFNTPAPAAVAGNASNWSAQGGTPIVLAHGETLDTISSRYGVPRAALMSANGLSSPNVSPGSRITIPVYNAAGASTAVRTAQAAPQVPVVNDVRPAAPRFAEPVRNEPPRIAATTPPQRPAASQAAQREARAAETRVAAARAAEERAAAQAKADADARAMRESRARFAAEAKAKADARKAAPPRVAAAQPAPVATPARPTPAPARPAVAARPEPARPTVVASAPPAQRTEIRKVESAPVQQPAADPQTTASIPKSEPAATPERADFRWPARGRVISGFSGKGGNEGINIAVPEGTPVKAAEGGVVAYAGNELKGYGNLVLIRHPNGYVSAYAHNGELSVKRGEAVKRGQVVAKAGQTGNVSTPQVHFELRKGATPVDPTPYLNN